MNVVHHPQQCGCILHEDIALVVATVDQVLECTPDNSRRTLRANSWTKSITLSQASLSPLTFIDRPRSPRHRCNRIRHDPRPDPGLTPPTDLRQTARASFLFGLGNDGQLQLDADGIGAGEG
jgi:hypothetical protein